MDFILLRLNYNLCLCNLCSVIMVLHFSYDFLLPIFKKNHNFVVILF